MKRILLFIVAAFSLNLAYSQVIKPVKWTFSVKNSGTSTVDLVFKATIKAPWHMYGINIPDNGPIPFSVNFEKPKGFSVSGKPTQFPKPEIVDDKVFNMKLELHNKEVTFTQRIKKTQADSIIIKGTLEYMTCSDMQCIPGDQDFTFRLAGLAVAAAGQTVAASSDSAQTAETKPKKFITTDTAVSQPQGTATASTSSVKSGGTTRSTGNKSLWAVMLVAMLAGLGGLLTPCVYPMIPMTVSYFLRGTRSRTSAILQALVFGLSIVFIYTLIGVLVAIFKNPNAVNNVTTHWATNSIFFLIFIALSASFFGMFEIILPSGLANKVDQQADRGGYTGAFFMALAMAILSFSCTGPIVAGLLIKASQGQVLEPVIGMAGFSLIFALPFTLFAIFPSWLKRLPKSGAWLNSIKIFFAFIMLAFAIYFLGKIDQSYHLNILTRPVYLSLWIVIFALMGLYFLGKIRFEHDNESSGLKFPGLVLSIASFSFALVLFTGLFGADLKGLSTLLPPPVKTTLVTSSLPDKTSGSLCGIPKYSEILDFPNGLQGYFDYDEAIACARKQNKPVLIDFGGNTCSNCKKMYGEVWSDPRVMELLSTRFILADLLTDERTMLAESEWYTNPTNGKLIKTLGKKNQDLQIRQFSSNALPLYIIINADGKELTAGRYTYDPDIEKFIRWLEEGLK
jgi:thiol:disulfide interchange protein DsbD